MSAVIFEWLLLKWSLFEVSFVMADRCKNPYNHFAMDQHWPPFQKLVLSEVLERETSERTACLFLISASRDRWNSVGDERGVLLYPTRDPGFSSQHHHLLEFKNISADSFGSPGLHFHSYCPKTFVIVYFETALSDFSQGGGVCLSLQSTPTPKSYKLRGNTTKE